MIPDIMPDREGALTLAALVAKQRPLARLLALGYLQKPYEIDTLTAELDRAFAEPL